MQEQQKLAEQVQEAQQETEEFDDAAYTEKIRVGQAILQQYPTVSTEEELDALPFGSVVICVNWQPANGVRAWEKGNWRNPDGSQAEDLWGAYASKRRSTKMMVTSRGRKRVYAVLFNPEAPIAALTPTTDKEVK